MGDDKATDRGQNGLQLTHALAALAIGRALTEAAPSVGGQSLEDELAKVHAFPQLAYATAAPSNSAADPLPQALCGIIVAYRVASHSRP